MLHRKTAGLLLLLVLASVALYAGETPISQAAPAAPALFLAPTGAPAPAPAGEPAMKTEAPLLPVFLATTGPGCNCDTQCGVCGGRLRGCYNGFPICECFLC